MHLNPGELVDIAEGTRAEDSSPHLAACEPCRAQLRELRAMMTTAKDVEVPEPSPLFWDHLSARINAAVEEESAKPRRSSLRCVSEGGPRRSWRNVLLRRPGVFDPMLAVGAVVLLIAVFVSSPVHAPAPLPFGATVTVVAPPLVADTAASSDMLDAAAAADDPSLMLVASLTDDLDFDAAREAGLASSGSAEHAVTHMSDSELRELRRLLTEVLARAGA